MEGVKQSKQALGAEVISRFNDFAPPTLLAQAARVNFSTRLFNLVVTNVPGPQIPLYVLGRELEDIFPVGFLPPNQALFIAIMSYNGGINFGLLADYDVDRRRRSIAEADRGVDRRAGRGGGRALGRRGGRREVPRRPEAERPPGAQAVRRYRRSVTARAWFAFFSVSSSGGSPTSSSRSPSTTGCRPRSSPGRGSPSAR